jgi:Family of unknown function (DUF6152)
LSTGWIAVLRILAPAHPDRAGRECGSSVRREECMKSASWKWVLAFVFLPWLAVPCLPHHGASPYDSSKLTTIKGTVSDFQFINPHVEIWVDATDDKGKTETWMGEANSPNVLSRHGWDRNIMKKGDQITVIGNRGKNGSKTLRLQKVILANGQELDPNSLSD